MKYLTACLGGLAALSLAVASNPASAGDYGGGASAPGYGGSSSGYGGGSSSGGCYKCPAPRNYDSQEVVKKTRDVDHTRVIETQSVVPSKRLIETNHLIVRENETRNVGTVQHNHTVIEKELILRKQNVDTKHVNTVVNLVEHKYNTERKRVVEEREIPGEHRDLRDCNCESKGGAPLRAYGMGTGTNSYGSAPRYVNSRY
jgi:hypothetical protein